MKKSLNILILEDMSTDVTLLQRAVLKAAPDSIFTVASSEEEFKERLGWGQYDVILSDYNLPGYNGLEALIHVRSNFGDLPFVFVTGTLNDEEAVARVILNGANGYILKTNMSEFTERFGAVWEGIGHQQEARRQQQERERRRRLKAQQLSSSLQAAGDFPEKEALQEILRELEGLL